MSTQDLSLLTGEQRELMNKYSALLVNPDMDLALLDEHEFGAFFSTLRGGEPYSIELTSSWVNRLIAARAENKQLRGALTAIAGSIYPAGNGTPLVGLIFEVANHALGEGVLENGEQFQNCTKYLAAIGSGYPAELRALLQSEKGGE